MPLIPRPGRILAGILRQDWPPTEFVIQQIGASKRLVASIRVGHGWTGDPSSEVVLGVLEHWAEEFRSATGIALYGMFIRVGMNKDAPDADIESPCAGIAAAVWASATGTDASTAHMRATYTADDGLFFGGVVIHGEPKARAIPREDPGRIAAEAIASRWLTSLVAAIPEIGYANICFPPSGPPRIDWPAR